MSDTVEVKDKVDARGDSKPELKTEWVNGVRFTWDGNGHAFVHMPVNNIPKKQFEAWIKTCSLEYSGKRWDMIHANWLKAKAYDALLMTMPEENELPQDGRDLNPDGLLSGGTD